MSTPNIFTRAWRFIFGDPRPEEIWQTIKTEFLRSEKTIECDWFGYTYWDVYALYQTSLTTGKTRIVQEWRVV